MITVQCSWCGKEIQRYPSQLTGNSYCSKECRSKHLSKKYNPDGYRRHPHLSELNKKLNPIRMTFSRRCALRNLRLGRGEGKTYTKLFGVHAHRVIAERKLGRKLLLQEVVHHIDGDKRNNNPDNLRVFNSQKEHARWHKEHALTGGDAE